MNNTTNYSESVNNQRFQLSTVENILLRNCIKSAIIENHLSPVLRSEHMHSLENCMYLIGKNYKTMDDDELRMYEDILLCKSIPVSENVNEKLDSIVTEIIESWRRISTE